MGRPIKKGLTFFPLDTDALSDLKLMKLSTMYGPGGLGIYIRILCLIYKEGYYLKISLKDLIEAVEITSHQFKQSEEEEIKRAIEIMFDVGLFDKELFNKESVLTSHGIQKRFNFIEVLSKRKYLVNEYCLLTNDEASEYGGVVTTDLYGIKRIIYGKTIDSSGEIIVNSEEKIVNSELSTQIKGNKNKPNETILNEIEINDRKESEELIPNYSEETFDDDDLPF